ncbi:MAG: hypothetical protein HQL50_05320 [Magnetococcales bacterium]|nr:hypothetical protein [Magnetococcales bacterium]
MFQQHLWKTARVLAVVTMVSVLGTPSSAYAFFGELWGEFKALDHGDIKSTSLGRATNAAMGSSYADDKKGSEPSDASNSPTADQEAREGNTPNNSPGNASFETPHASQPDTP